VEDFAAVGTRAQGRYQIPNRAVRPEHSYTVDAGLKLLKDEHRVHTAAFYTRYADAIVLAPTSVGGALASPEGDAYYHSVNASSADLYGVETALDVYIAAPLALFARGLVMRGVQKNPPNSGLPLVTPFDRVPPAQVEVGLRYRPVTSLELEGFVLGRGPQRRLNDPVNLEDNRIPVGGTPGYATYHARIKAAPAPWILARLSFDNLTNELALDHGSGFYRPGLSVTGSVELVLGGEERP
jgi:outer membrane receptor protein involved in Fe transport